MSAKTVSRILTLYSFKVSLELPVPVVPQTPQPSGAAWEKSAVPATPHALKPF